MTLLATYRIPGMSGAKTQAVPSADRPDCALFSAYAALTEYGHLLGPVSRKPQADIEAEILQIAADTGVPAKRADLFRRGLLREQCATATLTQVGSLTLDEYQRVAMGALTVAGGVLDLGCGLGKTATTVAATVEAVMSGRAAGTDCWIFCPLNAIPAWMVWVPVLQRAFVNPVRVISMDSAHKAHHDAVKGGVIIFDEVHLLGVPSSRRTKAAHRLRRTFDVGLCLTGTLLHGGIEKALSILDLAIPGAAGFASRWTCGEHFECLVRKNIGTRTVTELEKPGEDKRAMFMAWLSNYTVSMSKTSEIVRRSMILPEQQIATVNLCEPWRSISEEAVDVITGAIAAGEPLPHAAAVAHQLTRLGIQAKIDWLLTAMEGNDEPVVVFCEYRDSLDAVQEALNENKITYVRVDGDIVGADRLACRDKFQNGEVRVFLGQMDAACTSMDLFRARVSVAVDHTWKATNYNQMLARTCRRGQTRECFHFDLVANVLQARVVKRLEASEDFDAQLTEWQECKRALDAAKAAI